MDDLLVRFLELVCDTDQAKYLPQLLSSLHRPSRSWLLYAQLPLLSFVLPH